MGVSGCVILLVPELDILRSVGSLEPIDSNRGRAHLLPQILDRVTPSKVAPQRNFSFDWTKQKPFLCVGVVQMLARNTASRYIPGKKNKKPSFVCFQRNYESQPVLKNISLIISPSKRRAALHANPKNITVSVYMEK